jgi:hypothetical protein
MIQRSLGLMRFFGVEEFLFAFLRTEEIIPAFVRYPECIFFGQVCIAGFVFDHNTGLSFHFVGFFTSPVYSPEKAIEEIDQIGQDPVSDNSH